MDIAEARQFIDGLERAAEHHSTSFAHGRRMRWRQFGSGAPLVLLHGGHGNWLHWINNIVPLAARRTLLVGDIPGFGDSDNLPPGSRMHDIADAVSASLDALLGDGRTIDLAGFSFGAMVSAHIATRRGGVRRLALLGCPGNGTPERPRAELRRWRTAAGAGQDEALRHNLLARMLFHAASVDALAFRSYAEGVKATRFRSRGLARNESLESVLAGYTAPVLFLWGEHDLTATPDLLEASLTSTPPNRTLRCIADGGHWIQFEKAAAVNRELARWFGIAS